MPDSPAAMRHLQPQTVFLNASSVLHLGRWRRNDSPPAHIVEKNYAVGLANNAVSHFARSLSNCGNSSIDEWH